MGGDRAGAEHRAKRDPRLRPRSRCDSTENPPGAAYEECVQRICAELDSLAIDYVVVETGDDQTGRQAILGAVGDRGPLLYLPRPL